jgi:hypothetical protein
MSVLKQLIGRGDADDATPEDQGMHDHFLSVEIIVDNKYAEYQAVNIDFVRLSITVNKPLRCPLFTHRKKNAAAHLDGKSYCRLYCRQ